jgi:DNA-binding response OmpR family regulator
MINRLHTIVLTDDDEDDREFFYNAVQSTHPHIKLITFKDGIGLKDYLKDEPAVKPQLIFLDINMPRLNGFQVLSLIRKQYTSAELPVIMYTTSRSETDIDMAQKLGANMFFRKPNDYKILKQLVGKVLSFDWDNGQHNPEGFIL